MALISCLPREPDMGSLVPTRHNWGALQELLLDDPIVSSTYAFEGPQYQGHRRTEALTALGETRASAKGCACKSMVQIKQILQIVCWMSAVCLCAAFCGVRTASEKQSALVLSSLASQSRQGAPPPSVLDFLFDLDRSHQFVLVLLLAARG